ncbi:Periplasmic murein peptide-binding protein precursor [Labrenzia sp. THAF191b]|uniref:peptide ABC transporter substrate-binding protein n=1 Tax=unclassified Labrenzia TaxID=2648686 RepID=UPI0012690C16|nr:MULTISPECIES: peptide ABC transporter substrate-binding protein [unclassified Labrenzia]QFT00970.1 Periplasmic murein peptide-binding protein precursor [Labrenzia sp. THAF191b]QFT07283.1 Periplasmic murein peptide-binding protein precursor [Labrenzia sp. THAF191a]QFT18827.1 Periplasmic murein peptide-binding protein precursor [Labrenzia sp. THAF187b]
MFKSMRVTALAAALMAATSITAVAEVVYHRGNTADPETLDQHKTSTVYEAHILRDLYEGLVAYGADGQIIPGVASEWKVSDDGKTYTFMLRDDAKWSNGDPVVAGDFVFSLQRIMNPETGAKYANVLYPILNAEKVNKGEAKPEELGVKAVDDHTLEIALESPTPYFIDLLGHQTGLPVHPASVEKFGSDFVKAENIVTNGAFTLAEFVPNAHVKAVKNPHFHDADQVKIDTVFFYPTEDRGAALRRFQAGELHTNNDAPTEQVAFMRENLGDQFRVAPYLGTYYYALNHEDEVLKNPDVRQALSMAIDREFLADEIWGSTMVAGYSFVPPGIGNYGDPAYADYKDMSQIDREEKAIELLTNAGFGPDNPVELTINYNTSENHKNTAVAIADMWKPLGVNVKLINTDTKTHYAMLRDRQDFDVARAGWIGDYSDPQNFLFMVESDNDGFNYARYNNPEYDALMDEAAVTVDLEKRADILKKAEELFMRDLPFIPMMYYGSMNLVSDKMAGFEDNLLNIHPSRWMSISE